MKISDASVIVCSPGRNFVTLKIATEDGITGLGDATLNGRELAVAAYLNEHIIPLLIGRDARRIEDTWHYLYKGVYWRRGAVTMTAIAAVDTALWDIAGKAANKPVYQLFGGASRDEVLVYCHANGETVEKTIEAVGHYAGLGYRAIRAQCTTPGQAHAYGVAQGGTSYEPAERGLPKETTWSTEPYLRFAPVLFDRLRREFGADLHLLHDVHHRLRPIEAARLGKSLEPYHLFWIEDPVPAELQEGFRLIRQHTTTPIAVGEVFDTIYDAYRLIQEQLIDYLRASVVHAGGLTHLRKMAALAELYHVRTACHGATAPCIRGNGRVSGWISMKRSPRCTLISAPTCRLPGWTMARCTVGETAGSRLRPQGSGQNMTNFTRSLKPLVVAAVTLVVASGFSRTLAREDVNQLTADEKKAGWALLFDGKSLNGWRGYKQSDTAKTRWKVEDGLLTLDPGDGKDTRGALDIVTTATYDRFDLRWEWRIAEGGNSGLKYFVLEDMDSAIGHEYQLIDDERHADAKIGPHRQTSAFYDVLPAANRPIRPAGQWNQSRVVSNGKTIEHYLNGTKVLQYELESPALREAIAKSKFKDVARFGKLQNAHVLLQDHGNRVWYRNVKILRLPGGQSGTQNAPSAQAESAARGVQIVANEAGRRVDVTIDGKPFTSYIYPETLKKPVLYPLRSSKGTLVTRGYPLEPRGGERADHPHQVGLWFNHGDVNGLDFWNNSTAIGPDRAPKMGTIKHKKVVAAKSGADRGELVVESEWVQPDGVALLTENTRFVFRGSADSRTVDRITTLTALNRQVVFRDNKEGSLGLRVARQLEQPGTKPEMFLDADGKPMAKPSLNNDGVNGEYTSSEGLKGDAVWGTRARWVMLAGKIGSDPVTIAILDHPANPNSPTYWHARGYGLFSANVFSRKAFDPKLDELVLTLDPGKPVSFHHRILILDAAATPESIEREFRTFSAPSASSK